MQFSSDSVKDFGLLIYPVILLLRSFCIYTPGNIVSHRKDKIQ